MVMRVATTVQKRGKPDVHISLEVLFRPVERGRGICTSSMPAGIPLLRMIDGSWHPASDADAIKVWCSSGAAFAMNWLQMAGFDVSVEAAGGACDDFQAIEGMAVATSAATFVGFDGTDLLGQHLGDWELKHSLREVQLEVE